VGCGTKQVLTSKRDPVGRRNRGTDCLCSPSSCRAGEPCRPKEVSMSRSLTNQFWCFQCWSATWENRFVPLIARVVTGPASVMNRESEDENVGNGEMEKWRAENKMWARVHSEKRGQLECPPIALHLLGSLGQCPSPQLLEKAGSGLWVACQGGTFPEPSLPSYFPIFFPTDMARLVDCFPCALRATSARLQIQRAPCNPTRQPA
jgi:hypothetical protein